MTQTGDAARSAVCYRCIRSCEYRTSRQVRDGACGALAVGPRTGAQHALPWPRSEKTPARQAEGRSRTRPEHHNLVAIGRDRHATAGEDRCAESETVTENRERPEAPTPGAPIAQPCRLALQQRCPMALRESDTPAKGSFLLPAEARARASHELESLEFLLDERSFSEKRRPRACLRRLMEIHKDRPFGPWPSGAPSETVSRKRRVLLGPAFALSGADASQEGAAREELSASTARATGDGGSRDERGRGGVRARRVERGEGRRRRRRRRAGR